MNEQSVICGQNRGFAGLRQLAEDDDGVCHQAQFFAIFRRSTWKKKKFLVLFVIAGAQGLFGYPAAFFLRCLSRFPLNSGLCLLPSPCFPLFFRHASQVLFFPLPRPSETQQAKVETEIVQKSLIAVVAHRCILVCLPAAPPPCRSPHRECFLLHSSACPTAMKKNGKYQ